MNNLKKVLVIGYPGWLSAILVEKLLKCGFYIRVGVLSKDDVDRADIEVVECDLTKKDQIKSAIADVDYVVNCAGVIHPKKISDYYAVNDIGVSNLVEICNIYKVKKLIHISTNAVAGKSNDNSVRNEESPGEPLCHYGKSKYNGELNIINGCTIPYVILRPCMFYGQNPPQRHKNIYNIIKLGIFPIFGSGNYLRSVTSVDNLADAVISAINFEISNEIFYICDSDIYTTRSIIIGMGDAVGIRIRLIRLPQFIAKLAYFLDYFLQNIGLYSTKLHLIGESDWSVGFSNKKSKDMLKINYDSESYISKLKKIIF